MSLGKYLKDYPGLTKSERAEVLTSARRASMNDLSKFPRGIAVFVLMIWCGFVVFAIVKVILKIVGPSVSPILSGAIAGGIGAVVPSLVVQSRLPRYVYAELRARGHDVCAQCGYPRVGLNPAEPCPECATHSAPLAVD